MLRTRLTSLLVTSAVAVTTAGVATAAPATQQTRTAVDTNGLSGITTLASASSGGATGNGASSQPAVDDAGDVAFTSSATDLGPNVGGGFSNVYLRTAAGTTLLLSQDDHGHGGDGNSNEPVITTGGQLIAFHTLASNLVTSGPKDTNDKGDVVVYDRDPSGDGFDGPDYAITRVSINSTTEGDANSDQPAIATASGVTYVAYRSNADNLLDGGPSADTNGQADVFVHYGTKNVLASAHDNGSQIASADSNDPAIAVAGGAIKVAFDSTSDGVTSGDSNGQADVFLRTIPLGPSGTATTLRASGGIDEPGPSVHPSISNDGSVIVFAAAAADRILGSGATHTHIALAGTDPTSIFSRYPFIDLSGTLGFGLSNGDSTQPEISGDGKFAVYTSTSGDLLPPDGTITKVPRPYTSVFMTDLTSGDTRELALGNADGRADGASTGGTIDAHGANTAFSSEGTNLVGNDTNAARDVFRRQNDIDGPQKPVGITDLNHVAGSKKRQSPHLQVSLVGTDTAGPVTSGVASFRYSFSGAPANLTPTPGLLVSRGLTETVTTGPQATVKVTLPTGKTYFNVIAIDRAGNISPTRTLGPWLIDGTGPTVTGAAFPHGLVTDARKVALLWGAHDALSNVKSYDVFEKHTAPFSHTVRKTYLRKKTHEQGLATPRLAGGTTAFYVTARDTFGNATTKKIGEVKLPTAVTRLHFPASWAKVNGGQYYGGRAVIGIGKGTKARFAIADVRSGTLLGQKTITYSVVLLATTCPTCGKVAISTQFADLRLPSGVVLPYASPVKVINLHSAKTRHSVVFSDTVTLRADQFSGYLPTPEAVQLKVASSGRPVSIEALGTFASLPAS